MNPDLLFITHTSPLLEKVIALGKKNSKTLGLMPKDAYVEQAKKKCIAVAHENETLLGYCLFRITESKRRIGISQVCVETQSRRKGIAKLLLDKVRDKYNSILDGMLVSCRKDYLEACSLYEGYGFHIKEQVRSRSIEENYLNKFWYSFNKKDLFSIEPNLNDLRVALDLNIIIKLRDQGEGTEEIIQLLSDWLIDEVDYCYVAETYNEIHRDNDGQRAKKTIQSLSSFQELTGNPTESKKLLPLLKELHPGESPNHQSDRKQLAECSVAGIPYFITIDEELINHRDSIFEKLGVSIIRPSEFILEIDELKNRKLYEPFRLQGAQYELKRIDSTELSPVIDTFLKTHTGEKKSEFKGLILPFVSDVKNSVLKGVKSPDGNFIVIFGVHYGETCLTVELIRVKELAISNTLFNQISFEVVREGLANNKPIIRVSGKYLSTDQIQILIENGFYQDNDVWTKITLDGICSVNELRTKYRILEDHPFIINRIELIATHSDPEIILPLKLDLEKKLWPLKFEDLEIPTFIVPIKPLWASRLFDYLSSNNSLFGSPPELTWSKENVYYRSVNPNVEQFPARILWYASDEKGFERKMAIVACSYLNNVVIGEAKHLFSTFKRFGTYEWPQINELAKGDAKADIKVLQFSDTEVFQRMITYDTVKEVLFKETQKTQTFVSPVKIGNHLFNKLYRLAKATL